MLYLTSARSRRPLLSGNNFLLAALLICFLSCSTSKTATNNHPVSPQNKPAVVKPKTEPAVPEVSADKALEKKEEYTIALLLPFQSSKISLDDLMDVSGYYFPEESQLAVEYYQGAMIALDSLEQSGLNVRLLAYDVGLDTLQLKAILRKPELKEADLIIGPVGIGNMKIAAGFSLENKIYLVSPFTAAAVCKTENPYYIIANATMRSHCEKIYNYIRKAENPKQVFMLYRKKEADLELVSYFKSFEKSNASNTTHEIKFIELTDSTTKKYYQVKDVLSDAEKNIVIVPSNDEAFVRTVMKQLSGLSDDYVLEVFGMPTWINFDLILAAQFDTTATHVTRSYWIDKKALPALAFLNAYQKKYKINPTEYSVRGFDQMMFFGNLLLKDGKDLEKGFKKNDKNELAERFLIQPVDTTLDNHSILYYENKSVYMLKYEDGKLVKVND